MPTKDRKQLPVAVVLPPEGDPLVLGPDDRADIARKADIAQKDAAKPDSPVDRAAAQRTQAIVEFNSADWSLSSDWARDWPLLSEARDRLGPTISSIATLRDNIPEAQCGVIAAFRDIIGGGAVPVPAVRSDNGRLTAERVEALLAAAVHINLLTTINEIDAYFDSRRDREIFGPRSNLVDTALHPPAEGRDLQIRFFEVRVYWPALVKELVALGFPAAAEYAECRRNDAPSELVEPAPASNRPSVPDVARNGSRGPKPKKRQKVEAAMQAAIDNGRYTRETLRATTNEVLFTEFGTSISTIRLAKIKVLEMIGAFELFEFSQTKSRITRN